MKDTIPQILNEVKNLTATHISNPGQAFCTAFEYLNTYRFQAGLDTPGKGRYIGASDSAIMMWFTDAGNLSFVDRDGKVVIQNKLISGAFSLGPEDVYICADTSGKIRIPRNCRDESSDEL
ncbi:hypothetical protein HDU83_006907 [Entophlyctis luteolus]|nr:hypothetical protein HDU83_006907 [Entophlyctis luteolus]